MDNRKHIKLLELNTNIYFEFTFDEISGFFSSGAYTFITFVNGIKGKFYYKDFIKCLGKKRELK